MKKTIFVLLIILFVAGCTAPVQDVPAGWFLPTSLFSRRTFSTGSLPAGFPPGSFFPSPRCHDNFSISRFKYVLVGFKYVDNDGRRMKHTPRVTLILLLIFLCAQYVGLGIAYNYIDIEKTAETGVTVFQELEISGVVIERPEIDESFSFVYISLAILIGTGLILLIIKYNISMLWKAWYFIAIAMCLAIAFGAFIETTIALWLALLLAVWKIWKPNVLIHNFTELFVYGGLAVIFIPILNLFSIFVLLFLISLYDMYAVWKSKHMVKLAKFQTKAKMFAGLYIPYGIGKIRNGEKRKTRKKVTGQVAILGGGDIGFPLMFAGVVMKTYGLGFSLVSSSFGCLEDLEAQCVDSQLYRTLCIWGVGGYIYPNS